MGLFHKIARISKSKRYDGGPRRKGISKCFNIERWWNMVHREVAVGQFSYDIDIALNGVGISKERADTAQRSLV